jgi:hypothetical protein
MKRTAKTDNEFAHNFAKTVARAFSHEVARTPKRRRGEVGCLNLRVGGFPSQLIEDDYGFALVLYDLHHKDKAFPRAHDAYVIIRATKPERRHGKTQEIQAVKKRLGIRAFQTAEPGMIPQNEVLTFCRTHRDPIMRLELGGGDDIAITSSSIRFRWVSNDPGEMLPRFRAFALLVNEMTEAPRPQPLLFAGEWLLKSNRGLQPTTPKAQHSFGGTPKKSVNCPHCGARTNLMAQVDLADPALPHTRLSGIRLPVFWCLYCQEWDATFFDISGDTPKPLNEEGKKPMVKSIEHGEDDLAERRVVLVPSGKKAGKRSKVGGAPSWIQLEDRVDCPGCKRPMTFVLQLASNSHVEFHDMGLLYVFACPYCRIVASLVQSH